MSYAASASAFAQSAPLSTQMTPARRLAQALRAWERNARDALAWMHPAWLAHGLGLAEAEAVALARAIPRERAGACGLALIDNAGYALPDLDALGRAQHAACFDALPASAGLNVLRLRALRFRRAELRRIVDKRARASVQEWTGVALERLARETPQERASAPDIARLAMAPLATLDADALAFEGLALIERDGRGAGGTGDVAGDTRAPACPLLRLALPRTPAIAPRWVAQVPREIDANGTRALIAQLPELLPEWAWLFG
ncbi:type III secretion protein HrpB4 [Paraburkholderia acidisoli]|uniref:Type III secretion protein n=1 Tax=Paraburkholderia acidisoli TaxID=2571748 RepID=A0A7Z2GPX4_9BURK|nr:type III secretion protein HrpB4 [Paraburkholderia acidisoli]QGZ65818.1 type III secretion protein [Paraburkholderia acidisoli]